MTDPYIAMRFLVKACAHKTGQSYKLRGLLYSLWNGKPYSLLEIVTLDRLLRDNLFCVMENFGSTLFFYDDIKKPFTDAGLFDWFVEEGENTK